MDRDLVGAARRGDRTAFDALMRSELAGVYRTSLAILGSAPDAEEATQDAFVSAWRSLATLRDLDRFDAWLGRIVVNACRMVIRRRHGVRAISLDDERSPIALEASGRAGDPEARAISGAAFDRAFERLSIADRHLLGLAYLDDRPLAEIALRLGIPVGTVKSRLSRARAALARALADPA